MVSVEQDHCTLVAVKRYWDTPCVGGRHNFFQRPLVSKYEIKKVWTCDMHALLWGSGRFASICGMHALKGQTPITTQPIVGDHVAPGTYIRHLPGRDVRLIKKGLRLVWSRVIAL